MKWTTANIKNPNYIKNHEIYVGTQTGSFKKLVPAYEENPFTQRNLQDIKKLEKDSRITALAFANEEKSELLLGRVQPVVQLYSLRSEQVTKNIDVHAGPVVGVACYDNQLICGFANGQIQSTTLEESDRGTESSLITKGDDMARLRQCSVQRNLVATGGKGRQNNLKVFDMAANGKQIFCSKNLPNDYLQLEVPVWDSDVAFIDAAHTLATCSRHGYVRVYDTRKQRRPVQYFATEEQMSFSTLVAQGNYIYTGTTMGALKAFDIRRMKTFVHTYKGFTGSISDLCLDDTGKYLASACLDRYVRVHHADSCVLLYQCYVKSKATKILLRESMENPNSQVADDATAIAEAEDEVELMVSKKVKSKSADSDDDEYNEIFDNMQTICENDEADNNHNAEEDSQKKNVKTGSKRKANINQAKNKKKKN